MITLINSSTTTRVVLPLSLHEGEEHRRQAEVRRKGGPQYARHDLVFATGLGEPLSIRNLTNRHFRPLLLAAGVCRHLRLRHTFASLSLLAGTHPKVVSEALCHSSVAFTMDTYAHVLPGMQEAAAEKLSKLLFG